MWPTRQSSLVELKMWKSPKVYGGLTLHFLLWCRMPWLYHKFDNAWNDCITEILISVDQFLSVTSMALMECTEFLKKVAFMIFQILIHVYFISHSHMRFTAVVKVSIYMCRSYIKPLKNLNNLQVNDCPYVSGWPTRCICFLVIAVVHMRYLYVPHTCSYKCFMQCLIRIVHCVYIPHIHVQYIFRRIAQ